MQTSPGKGWNTLLRLYGPLQPWFDKSWKPGDFELVQSQEDRGHEEICTRLAAVVAVIASACGQAPTESAPAPSSAPAGAVTADIETRLGALTFERGYPTAETTLKRHARTFHRRFGRS